MRATLRGFVAGNSEKKNEKRKQILSLSIKYPKPHAFTFIRYKDITLFALKSNALPISLKNTFISD